MVNGDSSSRLSVDTPTSNDQKIITDSARPRKKKLSLFAQKKAQLLKAKQGGQLQVISTPEVEQSETTAEYFPKATVVYQSQLPEEKKKSASQARELAGEIRSMGQVGMGDDVIIDDELNSISKAKVELASIVDDAID